MSRIPNRVAPAPGARYRVCPWHDIYDVDAHGKPKLAGYGLGEKPAGARHYLPVAWKGDVHPWPTLQEARAAVEQINAEARRAAAH